MKPIIARLFFNLNFYLYFVAYFVITRFLFLAYHFDLTSELDRSTFWMIPLKGLRLDLAAASYFTLFPILVSIASIWLKNSLTKAILNGYTYIIIFFVNILFLFDIGLYRAWGMRLDATPLMYLNTPKEMFASVPTPLLIGAIAFWAAFSLLLCFLFKRIISSKIDGFKPIKYWTAPILLLCIVPVGIAGRGGLQTIPVNQSNVYFSDVMYANHASVNFTWSFINALSYKTYSSKNPFNEMEANVANNIITEARASLKVSLSNDSLQLLNSTKPNVILILWESLTAKVVAPLGGEKDVTPNLNSLIKEGIFFDHFYSNGDRSDKGLISILSGYPPQPDQSIIKNTNKASTLPFLTKEMAILGYHNAYYYGGDLNFGNMNTYLRNGGITEFVSGVNFEKKDWNSKWGVHDHVLLERFLTDINKEQKVPFFKTLFTLTSHEPFEFPGEYAFGKDSDANLFRSAQHYTDAAIGQFITEAKKQSWWENTLVVIMADHGHALPAKKEFFHSPSKFHIPMLWIGGALAIKDTVVSNIATHTDFAYSLLPLLNGDNRQFTWGNNLFVSSDTHYAHYVYNKGFGVINKDGAVVYDYHHNRNVIKKGLNLNYLTDLGLALTQMTYQDYLDRK
jgi:phosphoglycerol transferase MdoB-like AlkP superfamily enzyme